jgi:hypothetical protein
MSSACGQLAAALYGAVRSKLANFHGNELDTASNRRGVAFQRGFGDLCENMVVIVIH